MLCDQFICYVLFNHSKNSVLRCGSINRMADQPPLRTGRKGRYQKRLSEIKARRPLEPSFSCKDVRIDITLRTQRSDMN